jgi:hypothetical protein
VFKTYRGKNVSYIPSSYLVDMFWTKIVNLRMTWNRSKHILLFNKWNLLVFWRISTWFRLDFRLPPRCWWGVHSSGILRSLEEQSFTDVSGHRIGSTVKTQEVHEEDLISVIIWQNSAIGRTCSMHGSDEICCIFAIWARKPEWIDSVANGGVNDRTAKGCACVRLYLFHASAFVTY